MTFPARRLLVLAIGAVVSALVAAVLPASAYPGAPWFKPSEPYDANFPDPSIVVDGGTYYAYGTSTGGAYLPVMTSTDAVTWTARPSYAQPACVGGAVDPYYNDALPCPARWAPDRYPGLRLAKEVWAPGAAKVDGHWVVFYSVRMELGRDRFCISVATADGPLGPFIDSSSGPIVCDSDPNGSIDPQPFVDADGSAWLLWKSEGVPGSMPTRIWSQRLGGGGTALVPGTRSELLRTSLAWEGNVIENPAMVRHGGSLYLFYSGNEFRSASYAIGYADCASMSGPCTKHGPSPLLASRGDRLGPGGPAPFVDTSGALRLAYHWWNAPYTSYPPYPACQADSSCTTQGQRRMAVDWVVPGSGGLQVTGTPPVRPPVQPLDPACPEGGVPEAGFVDVPAGSTHSRAVDCVAWWGLTGGTSSGVYSPAAPVTRGQMASFIARLLRATDAGLQAGVPGHFTDVPEGSPHQADIDALAQAGIVSGRADGSYQPGSVVSRAQMATFLIRSFEAAVGEPLPSSRDWFPDDSGNVHEAAINKAATAGLTSGRDDGTYGPASSVTRAQMASFLARTLAGLVDRGHAALPA